MKTIVVAGGAGFIGSHLCESLLQKGSKVICLDNFVTGRKQNVGHLLNNKAFSLVEHDITKPIALREEIGQVYNLASPASPIDFAKMPVEIMLTNSLGAKNLLDLAVESRARFLEASTSEVYGNPLQHPQKETYWGNVNPVGTRSCYDESKRFAEALVTVYSKKKGLETRIARIFNTFGPRMRKDDGRAVPAFISNALQGKPIPVFGTGKQTRSFCFVSDLVEGLERLMASDYSMPVNLGNPAEITILELAEKVKELSGSSSEIEFKKLPKDDPVRRKPDIGLARERLAWQPKVFLDEGLKKTIDFFKSNGGA